MVLCTCACPRATNNYHPVATHERPLQPTPEDKANRTLIVDMPVGGYDPEDLDDALEERMNAKGRDPSNWLTDEELRQWEEGESLVDLLDEDDIHEILQKDGETAG